MLGSTRISWMPNPLRSTTSEKYFGVFRYLQASRSTMSGVSDLYFSRSML
ncbi:hypothetical protein [Lysobacter gummosus]